MKYQKPNLLSWLWALSLFSILLIGPGCATSTTVQSDQSYNDDGTPLRLVTTTTKVRALFNSNAKLAGVKISNTDKTQSTSIGQAESASQEKLSDLVQAVAQGVVAGMNPAP